VRSLGSSSLLLIAIAFAGCAGEDASAYAALDAGIEADGFREGDADAENDGAEPCRSYAAGADSDDDGLPDRLEDANLNCIVDPGETDPQLADSDGDGLPDGVEDVDGDGRWDADQGELDPKAYDTDGDGVSDGDDVLAAVCTSALVDGLREDQMRDDLGIHGVLGWSERVNGTRDTAWIWNDAGAFARTARGGMLASAVAAASDAAAEQGWTLGERIATSDRVWLALDTVEPVAVEWVAEVLSGDAEAPSARGGTQTNRFEVLLSSGAEARGGARSILGVAASVKPFAVAALEPLSWRSVPPDADARPRAFCERLSPASESAEVQRIIWAVDTTLRGTVGAVEDVLDALEARIAAGAEAGWRTEVWMVAGDAHVNTAPGAALHAAPLESAEAARDVWTSAPPGTPDQRLLANALAFVEQLAAYAEPAPTLVLLDGAREDAEFREGVFMGRDGDPYGLPLDPGASRQARVDYYAARLQEADARVVARGPGVIGVEPPCSRVGGEARPLPDDAVAAIREVAHEVGGVFFDGCRSSGALFVGLFAALPVDDLHGRMSREPIPGTLRVGDEDGELLDVGPWVWGVEPTALGWTTGDERLGSGYLYWE
jgi:hypothetical protein